MAVIAAVFHWPPSEMYVMDVDELQDWYEQAIETWNQMNEVS